MRLPRLRFAVRRMMMAVVAVALLIPVSIWLKGIKDGRADLPPGGAAKGANSVSAELDITQIDKFVPGRLMDEILRDLQWVGNFEMATEQHGKALATISFFIRPTKPVRFYTEVWALFVADRFVKFVDLGVEEPAHPIRVGTFPTLEIVAKRPSVATATIKQQIKDQEDSEPPFDSALAAAFVQARAKFADALRRQEEENAQLRDQFNAARLKLGMTKAEVAAMLRAKPLESGIVESGPFEIYGSTRPACSDPSRSYHNILALYRGDRLAGIYSGRSGPDLDRPPSPKPEEQVFIGLPASMAKPKDDSREPK
jgi:hypothetical protein